MLTTVSAVQTYTALAGEIYATPPRLGQVRLVTIDGPSGSGKSAFARALVDALSSRGSGALVEIEALYEGWTLEGAARRLDELVLEPLAAGWPGGFHPYDWTAFRWSSSWRVVPISQVVVVEGCGSSARAHAAFISCQIWIEAPPEVALARGLTREGIDLDRRLREWQLHEAAHFAADGTRGRADLRVDGNPAGPLSYDPDLAFTVLT